MAWNYRMCAERHKQSIVFTVREVYYDIEGQPEAYSADGRVSAFESEFINRMGPEYNLASEFAEWQSMISKVIEKPILWIGDRWPEEYIHDEK